MFKCEIDVFRCKFVRFLGIGVFLGETKGLAVLLEHLDLGECGPGEIGVKLKFFRLVLGLGGTGSSCKGVSKLTRLLVAFVCMLVGILFKRFVSNN